MTAKKPLRYPGLYIFMGLSGRFLVPGLLRRYGWRFNGMGAAVGPLAGMTAASAQRNLWPDMGKMRTHPS